MPLLSWAALGRSDFTDGVNGAEPLRRRPCYANFRLLQLPRLRWVWPRWRRPPPLPGAATAGTAAGMAVGAGAAHASSSRDQPTATAAALCGGWSRHRGD